MVHRVSLVRGARRAFNIGTRGVTMITKPLAAIGFAAALALAGSAQAQNTAPNSGAAANQGAQSGQQKLSKADQSFLKEAIQGDLAEVQMGQLAQQKGLGDDVKQFGQMLQQDHGQHLQQAQQMAQQNGMTAPNDPPAEAKKVHDKLSKMSGAQFDKTFAKDMVSDHKKDIAKYQKEAKGNGPLAQFAQQTLPVLQKHLQTAQQIEQKGAAVGSKAGAK
jgi:putative membrane protein